MSATIKATHAQLGTTDNTLTTQRQSVFLKENYVSYN